MRPRREMINRGRAHDRGGRQRHRRERWQRVYEDCLASTPQVAVNTLRRLSSLQPQGVGIHAWLSRPLW